MQSCQFQQERVPDTQFPEKNVFQSGRREIGFAALKTDDGRHIIVLESNVPVAYVCRPGREVKLFGTSNGTTIGRKGAEKRARNKHRHTHHSQCYPALVVEASGELRWSLSYGFPDFLCEGFLEADEIAPEVKEKITLPLMQVLNREQMGPEYVRRYFACAIKDAEVRQLINPTIH